MELQSKLLNAVAISSFKQNIVVFGLIQQKNGFSGITTKMDENTSEQWSNA